MAAPLRTGGALSGGNAPGARDTASAPGTAASSGVAAPRPSLGLAEARQWQSFVKEEQALYVPDSLWVDLGSGVSFQGMNQTRISKALQTGYRFGRSGGFLHVEHAQIFGFTREQNKLTFINVGAGYENLWLLGRLRFSAALGASILTSKTDVDSEGTWGYFLDLRPVAIRWRLPLEFVFWVVPTAFNVSIPVPNGIPLVFIHHQLYMGVEKWF